MWPILLDGKFLTIIQVDAPKLDEGLGVWIVPMLDIRGGIHKPLYSSQLGAYRAWKAFRDFATQANRKGVCIWLTDMEHREVEIQEG